MRTKWIFLDYCVRNWLSACHQPPKKHKISKVEKKYVLEMPKNVSKVLLSAENELVEKITDGAFFDDLGNKIDTRSLFTESYDFL